MTPSEVRERLRAYICTELMQSPSYPLGDDEPLITGGLIDSFSLAYLAVFIEATFGLYIPDVELTVDRMDTVTQIASRITGDGADPA